MTRWLLVCLALFAGSALVAYLVSSYVTGWTL